ncbi:RNase3 domain protein [Teladorsagia circumcincta]|uniref:RNase3 domain protein n=1 Tax=Teladorsagia circumcincta TaxID=45464 RepID=A0A2G9UCZ8_TELCI|nr:RNase3 domain protein [Teladorsagia circumcincta]
MREKLNTKYSRQEFDDDCSVSESDDETISSVSDLQFSDVDNIVISDDTSELEEGEVLESGEDDRDDEKGAELTLDQEVFRRLMEEEVFFHRELPAVLPLMPVSRWINEYEFHFEKAPMINEFEKIIDYKFANRSLIELAFTHPSYKNDFGTNVDHVKTTLTNCLFRRYAPFTENNEKKKGFRNLMHIMSQSGSNTAGLSKVAHNERLEYLGDAVVELIVSSRLFFILPHQEEGGLATYRSALVQNRNLAALGKKLRLGDWMMYAHGIDLCDEEDFRKSLANTFEAVLAAIYLDGGIEECDRIFADAMFGDDATVKDHWLNVPEHPLKVEQPNGDRMIIDDTDELLELTDLEEILGFRFQNIRLLAKALTRRNVPYNTLTWPVCFDIPRFRPLSLVCDFLTKVHTIPLINPKRNWKMGCVHFIESKKWNDSKSQLQQCCLAMRELDTGDSSAPEMPEYRTIAQMNAAKKALEEYKEMFSSISRNNVKNAANAFMKKLQEAQQRPSTYTLNEEPRPRPLPLIGSGSSTSLSEIDEVRSSEKIALSLNFNEKMGTKWQTTAFEASNEASKRIEGTLIKKMTHWCN